MKGICNSLHKLHFILLQTLPKVNKDLALKLIDEEQKVKKKKKNKSGTNLLKDDRFQALFENPDFEVDKNAEEYRPVLKLVDFNVDICIVCYLHYLFIYEVET